MDRVAPRCPGAGRCPGCGRDTGGRQEAGCREAVGVKQGYLEGLVGKSNQRNGDGYWGWEVAGRPVAFIRMGNSAPNRGNSICKTLEARAAGTGCVCSVEGG